MNTQQEKFYYRSACMSVEDMWLFVIQLGHTAHQHYTVYIDYRGFAYFEMWTFDPTNSIMAVPPTHPNPPERSIPNY